MSTTADPFRRRFVIGVGVALAVMVAIGGLIAVFGTGADRPEGAAERWLTAVSDSTRSGVARHARDRAAAIGDLALAEPLMPSDDTDGEAAFSDLEVGDADHEDDTARVPYRLHQFTESGSGPVVEGTIVLARVEDRWRIVALDERLPGELVPSEGGAAPTEAPFGAWLGAIAIGALLAVLASLAVRAAGREPASA